MDARVHIFTATALGRGRVASPTLGRLYPGEIPRYSLYRRLSGPQGQSGHEGMKKNLHPSEGSTVLKFVALQLRRSKTDRSSCCQMVVQGTLWLAKRYPSILISVFLTGFRYLYQVATQLSSRDWVDPVPDPILPEKFLGYSRDSNPGPLG